MMGFKPKNEEEAFLQDHFSPDQKWGYLDQNGQLAIEDIYDDTRDFSENLAAVNYKGKWGYIDVNGKKIVDYIYKEAHPFSNGKAIVRQLDNSWSVIDIQGNPQYAITADRISLANNDIIKVQENGLYGFLNIDGDTLLATQHSYASDFHEGYALVKYFNEYRLVNTSGDIMPLAYDKVYKFSDNTYRYRQNKRYGYLTAGGKELSKPLYTKASDFMDDMALVKIGKAYQLINKEGKTISSFPPRYTEMEYLGQGLVSYYENGLWGIIDTDQELIAAPIYDMLYRPREGMLAYGKNDLWGFMDVKGTIVTQAIFPLVWDYHEGIARIVYPEKAIGFIDKQGKLSIPPYFYEIKDYYNGRARVQIYR